MFGSIMLFYATTRGDNIVIFRLVRDTLVRAHSVAVAKQKVRHDRKVEVRRFNRYC